MLKTNDIRRQMKQFHGRQGDKYAAYIYWWGYLSALKHNLLIGEEQYKILDKYNGTL